MPTKAAWGRKRRNCAFPFWICESFRGKPQSATVIHYDRSAPSPASCVFRAHGAGDLAENIPSSIRARWKPPQHRRESTLTVSGRYFCAIVSRCSIFTLSPPCLSHVSAPHRVHTARQVRVHFNMKATCCWWELYGSVGHSCSFWFSNSASWIVSLRTRPTFVGNERHLRRAVLQYICSAFRNLGFSSDDQIPVRLETCESLLKKKSGLSVRQGSEVKKWMPNASRCRR